MENNSNTSETKALPEGRKFVMNGAVLKCTLCSKPEGSLKVTSNSLKLQEMHWANVSDTNGAQNLIFDGVCNHPSYGNNKPPCKSVIQLKGWDSPGSTIVQDAPSLIMQSKNYCVPHGNHPIEITDSGQKNTVNPVNVASGPAIRDAFWIESNSNQAKTNLMPYGQLKAYLKINFTASAVQSRVRYKIGVYEKDTWPFYDTIFEDVNWKVATSQSTILSFDLTPALFEKGKDAIAELYFTVNMESGEKPEFCNSDSERLKVHFVRYIPGVMRHLGWPNGATLQDRWFERAGSENPGANNPVTDVIKMDWILQYPRAKNLYDSFVRGKIWANPAGKRALTQELKNMKRDGLLVIPASENQSVNFGNTDATIVTHNQNKVPKFDKYHYQERAFVENAFNAGDDDLDDLYAALANFVFRVGAAGTITRKGNHFQVRITQALVYMRDSFNFIDEGWNQLMSQPLGYWNIKDNKASTKSGDGFRYISNDSYNKYREDYNKGGDFLVFSDIKTVATNDEFQVPLNTF